MKGVKTCGLVCRNMICGFMWVYVGLCGFMWIYVGLCELIGLKQKHGFS